MRNYVIINGVNSLTIQGLAINIMPPISKPPMRTLREEIDGRDGDITTELGYGAYDRTMEIGLYGNYDIDEVIAFFNSKGTIVFSDEDDKYYNFEITDRIDYSKLIKFRTASINFHCQPFKYPLNETPLEEEYEYVEGEGTELALNDTANAIFNKFDLKGNTSQVQYTGKNLLKYPYSDTTKTTNGITFTDNGDGSITINGTSTGQAIFYFDSNGWSFDSSSVLPTGTYTFNKLATNNNVFFYINIYKNDGTNQTYSTSTGNTTFTITGTQSLNMPRIAVASGVTLNNVRVYPQLELGSTATSYEPYVGGTASPNPSYPQPVNVVSGDNYINICGKNLLNIDNWVKGRINVNTGQIEYANNTTSMIISDNSITFTVSQAWNSGIASDFIPIGQGNYAFTYSHDREISMYINTYDANKTYIERIDAYTQTATPTTRTFTISNANVKYIRIHFAVNTATTYVVSNMQVEKGSTATTYEPYIGSSYPLYLGVENLIDSDIDFERALSNYGNVNAVLKSSCTLKAGTYTISFDVKADADSGRNLNKVNIYNASTLVKAIDYYKATSTHWQRMSIPLVLDSETTFNTFAIQVANAGTYFFKDFQVEKGTKANSYTPFGTTPIELCKIGTYQDYIYKDNGVWLLHKEIGKDKLSSSNVVYHGVDNYKYQFEFTPSQTSIAKEKIYSTHFYNNSSTQWWTIDNNIYLNGASVVYITSTQYTSITSFNNFTSTNDVYVYYPLATPTNTLIEDTNLIEQLESLSIANSIQGQTNISQENNDLPFILEVSALKDGSDHLIINNIGNIYAKPTLDLEGNGIVGIYLNDTQMFEVDLSETNEIVINTQEMEAYNPTTNALANRQVVGDYSKFKLDSGENDLRFSGALTSATITRYIRWL